MGHVSSLASRRICSDNRLYHLPCEHSYLQSLEILNKLFLRAGAAGCLKYPTGCLKKNLGAEHQKNRSRENAFAEVLSGR